MPGAVPRPTCTEDKTHARDRGKTPGSRRRVLPKPKQPARYIVFRGNGGTLLREALRRRSHWETAPLPLGTPHLEAGSFVPRGAGATAANAAKSGEAGGGWSKQEENLLLTRALAAGGVAFVFRDLLRGPHDHRVAGAPTSRSPDDLDARTCTCSLFDACYPAHSGLNGVAQIVSRWPSMHARHPPTPHHSRSRHASSHMPPPGRRVQRAHNKGWHACELGPPLLGARALPMGARPCVFESGVSGVRGRVCLNRECLGCAAVCV